VLASDYGRCERFLFSLECQFHLMSSESLVDCSRVIVKIDAYGGAGAFASCDIKRGELVEVRSDGGARRGARRGAKRRANSAITSVKTP